MRSAPSANAAFDGARLLALVGGDEGARREVIALFQGHAPPLSRSIQAAADRGDVAAVRAGAHKLKGMLVNIGASDGAKMAGELEDACRNGVLDQFVAVAARLMTEVNGICAAMAADSRSAA